MKRITMILALLLFSMQLALAQRVITGTVTDNTGEPIPGATVQAKGVSGVGTITDFDGNYRLDVPDGATALKFSSVGLQTQEIPIGSSNVINATLKVGLDIEEVVVTGYQTQNKRDVTGSISTVNSEALEKRPVQSIERAIQGRAAGVQVQASSGAPGAAVEVRIRGTGSINASNQPLYIVDGVQINTGDNTQMNTSANSLGSLNPEDIESIEILKDAATASIYGAQAANGVVLITTKRGKAGKTQFNFTATTGWAERIRDIEVCDGNQFIELTLESFGNSFGYDSPAYQQMVSGYLQNGFVQTEDGTKLTPVTAYTAPTFDWKDAVFRKGMIQDYQLSARGGNEKTRFYIGGGYSYNEGPVIETDFTRASLRTNIDHDVNDWFSINLSNALSSMFLNTVTAEATYANPYNSSLGILPTDSIYLSDGSYNSPLSGGFSHNIVAENKANTRKGTENRLVSSLSLNFNIAKGLNFKSSYGLDYIEIREDERWDPRYGDGANYDGLVRAGHTRVFNWQTNQVLTYNKVFNDKHNVSALAGFEYRYNQEDVVFASGTGLPNYKYQLLNAVAEPSSTWSGYANWKMVGIFGKVEYNYAGKYYANFTLRRDGSSRFGDDQKFGLFPGGSVMWRFSEENFMSGLRDRFVDDMKVKFAYGITGNSEIGDYASRGLFTAGAEYNGYAGMLPEQLANGNLSWEESRTMDIGFDFGLFNGKVSGMFNYFVRENLNLLLEKPLPRTSGFEDIWANVGEMENVGYEAELEVYAVSNENFEWIISANFTEVKNKVTHLVTTDTLDYFYYEDYQWVKVGEPVFTGRYGQWAGVNPADGRPMWYDKNGELIYEAPRFRSEDAIWTGGTMDPPYFGGFGSTFNFYGFELDLFFQFAMGHRKDNTNMQIFGESGNSGGSMNQLLSQYEERWQEPGDVTWVAKPMLNSGYLNNFEQRSPSYPTTRDYEKADYLRLKTVTLTYNLPKEWLSRVKLETFQIFASGTNVWTWTHYKGWDPEFTGLDWGVYPQNKVYNFGIKTSF